MRASQELKKKSSVFRVGDFENDNARTERFTRGAFGKRSEEGRQVLYWIYWLEASDSELFINHWGTAEREDISSTENSFLKISNKKPLEKRGKRFFTVSRFFLLHFECPIFAQPLIFLVQRMTDFKEVRQYHRRTWWKCGSSLQKTPRNHKFC